MPSALKRHKLPMLQPRLKEIDPVAARGIKMVKTTRTLKDKQQSNGRTLALDGAAWKKLRAYVLSGEPLCRHCTARNLTVPATEVDHRNGPNDNRLESLQPLCKSCHSRQTMRDMGYKVSMGCDEHGKPLDPNHPWNNAPGAVLDRSLGSDERKPIGSLHAHRRS